MTKTETRIREIFAKGITKLGAVDDEYRQQYGEPLDLKLIQDIRFKWLAETTGQPNAIAEVEPIVMPRGIPPKE